MDFTKNDLKIKNTDIQKESIKDNVEINNINKENSQYNSNFYYGSNDPNLNFENNEVYDIDFLNSMIKSNIDVKEQILNQKLNDKEITLYKNLEDYINENNLVNLIDPKNLFTQDKEIKVTKNFENNFEEIIDEKNKIIHDLTKIISSLKEEYEIQRKVSVVAVIKKFLI